MRISVAKLVRKGRLGGKNNKKKGWIILQYIVKQLGCDEMDISYLKIGPVSRILC
jgi:hypothetical protein